MSSLLIGKTWAAPVKLPFSHPHPQNLGSCDFFPYYFHARHALNSACERAHSFPAEQGVVLPQRLALFSPSSWRSIALLMLSEFFPGLSWCEAFLRWGLFFSSGIPCIPTENTHFLYCGGPFLCHCGEPQEKKKQRLTRHTSKTHCLPIYEDMHLWKWGMMNGSTSFNWTAVKWHFPLSLPSSTYFWHSIKKPAKHSFPLGIALDLPQSLSVKSIQSQEMDSVDGVTFILNVCTSEGRVYTACFTTHHMFCCFCCPGVIFICEISEAIKYKNDKMLEIDEQWNHYMHLECYVIPLGFGYRMVMVLLLHLIDIWDIKVCICSCSLYFICPTIGKSSFMEVLTSFVETVVERC